MNSDIDLDLFCFFILFYLHIIIFKYLGVKFTYNGHWDAHSKELVTAGKRKVNSLGFQDY